MKAYISIKRMRAQHCNSMTSYNVMGAPAITAHLGFAGAIAHRFGLSNTGVAILHHGQDHEGHYHYGSLAPNRVRGVPIQSESTRPTKMQLSDQPFALSHYEASFLIELEGDDLDFNKLAEAISHEDELKNILLSRFRFAGGVIVSIGGIAVFSELEKAEEFLPKTGFWVLDRKDLLENRKDGDSVLDASINGLYPEEKNGWMGMSLVGYLRLTDFETRNGVRQDLPHAFAEPLLGMIEYRSKRSVKSVFDEALFWKYQQPAADCFVAQADFV